MAPLQGAGTPRVIEGQTTKEMIQSKYGMPHGISFEQNGEVWTYYNLPMSGKVYGYYPSPDGGILGGDQSAIVSRFDMSIEFDNNGVVKKFTYHSK